MSNVVRHAGASQVWVAVDVGREVVLRVRDDGTGLRPEQRSGNGLPNLRDRAAALGGRLELTSDRQGTTVTWCVPLQ